MTVEDRAKIHDLEIAVHTWLIEHYPADSENLLRVQLPDGLRLEVHPSVAYLIRSDFDSVETYGLADEHAWKARFIAPMKITNDLPRDTWRLVTVTEDVHVGGNI